MNPGLRSHVLEPLLRASRPFSPTFSSLPPPAPATPSSPPPRRTPPAPPSPPRTTPGPVLLSPRVLPGQPGFRTQPGWVLAIGNFFSEEGLSSALPRLHLPAAACPSASLVTSSLVASSPFLASPASHTWIPLFLELRHFLGHLFPVPHSPPLPLFEFDFKFELPKVKLPSVNAWLVPPHTRGIVSVSRSDRVRVNARRFLIHVKAPLPVSSRGPRLAWYLLFHAEACFHFALTLPTSPPSPQRRPTAHRSHPSYPGPSCAPRLARRRRGPGRRGRVPAVAALAVGCGDYSTASRRRGPCSRV